jgi:transitional endoplasmic reticulum ATPase
VSGDVEKRIISQLLTLMDGLMARGKVVVIGATNRPDIIDEALLRPGRFDRIIDVPLPDKDARRQILLIHTKKKPLDSTWDINKVIELTEGYTGADLEALVNAAAIAAIKEHIFLREKSRKLEDVNEISDSNDNHQKDYIQENQSKSTGLKISMKHFEDALKKIRKRNDFHMLGIPNTKIP